MTKLLYTRGAYSTKTRIKTQLNNANFLPLFRLAAHIPLKQGLRHRLTILIDELEFFLAAHIPLKQGLRLSSFSILLILWSRGAYSTKTRIKTERVLKLIAFNFSRAANSTKKRIKTTPDHL